MKGKEIGVNTRNWSDSAQYKGLLESPCECGIELSCSIIHAVSTKLHVVGQDI